MTLLNDLRIDIGDETSSRYSNSVLYTIIEKSARKINRELNLVQNEKITVQSGVITNPTTDDDIYDLVLMQAECLLIQKDANTGVGSGGGDGVVVRDGEQTIDMKGRSDARNNYLAGDFNPCKELRHALRDEKLRRSQGKLVW